MLRRVTFTVSKDSNCEHSVTIGRSEGSGSYCYADEAEAEIERWKAEALAARKIHDCDPYDEVFAKRYMGKFLANYAAARAANEGER